MSDLVLTDRPAVALPALTKTEAEAIAAFDQVLRRYRMVEWLRCVPCFEGHREDGVRMTLGPRLVRIECRCGLREFAAPTGTTDLSANRSNSALTLANQGDVTVVDGQGHATTLKALRMEPEDAAIFRLYTRVVTGLRLKSHLAFRDCFRAPYDVFACETLVTPSAVAVKCAHPDLTAGCRVVHYSGSSTTH